MFPAPFLMPRFGEDLDRLWTTLADNNFQFDSSTPKKYDAASVTPT
jgi:hypothetical protein